MLSDDECHICFDRVSRHQRQRCVHRYHRGCLQRWRTVRRTWNGQCFHCQAVVDETAAAQSRTHDDDDPDPDPMYEASPFVRRCPFCRSPFVRVSGCRIVTCICGEEFITDAPLLPEPSKEESWWRVGVTISLIWALGVFFSVAFFAFQTHPNCVAEQEQLFAQCYSCWHKYHILDAGIEGMSVCEEQELEPDMRWFKEASTTRLEQQCIECDIQVKDRIAPGALRNCSIRQTIVYIYELVMGGGGGVVGEVAGAAGATTGVATGGGGGSKGNKQPVSMTTESISVVLASR